MSDSGRPRPARLRLGRIVRPHGLAGEVVVRETPLDAEELARVKRVVLTRHGEVVAEAGIAGARGGGGLVLVRLEGVERLEEAEALRGLVIEAERPSLPDAGPGTIYHHDLLGLEVRAEDGRTLGRVRGVIATGANEVLQVEGASGELLIPYHPQFVLGWDPAAGRLDVRLPAGLEEVYRAAPESPARS